MELGELVGDAESLQFLDFGVVFRPLQVVLLFLPEAFEGGRDFVGEDLLNFLHFGGFFLDRFQGGLLFVFEHASPRGLFDHPQDLVGFHVEDLGDAALHNEEVGVVHIQLHGMEEILDLGGLDGVAVDEVLVLAANHDLAGDGDLVKVLVAHRAGFLVGIVKVDADRGLGHPGLALLVDELLEVADPDLGKVGDAEDEADGVEDVGLAAAVQARDGIKAGVKARDHRAGGVGLEAVDDHLLDVHGCGGGLALGGDDANAARKRGGDAAAGRRWWCCLPAVERHATPLRPVRVRGG